MNSHPPVTGLILAGGQSRRMGTDKAALLFEGQPLLARTVDVVQPLVDELIISGPESLDRLVPGHRIVRDDLPGVGPIGGLLSGLRRSQHTLVLTVACDLPFLGARLLSHLIDAASGFDAAVPVAGGVPQPVHAVYACSILPVVEEQIAAGCWGLQRLLDRLHVRWIRDDELNSLDVDRRSFQNVNTPKDWHAAGVAAERRTG